MSLDSNYENFRRFDLELDGYTSKLLGMDDLEDIKKLYNECEAYFIIEQGKPATDTDAENILSVLPPNKSIEDKFVIGVYNTSSSLVAIVDLVKDFPEKGEWMLGLLLISTHQRGRGLGKAINAELIRMIQKENGKKIRVGVISNNELGLMFWKSQNYFKLKESTYVNNGVENTLIVMNYVI